MRVRAYFSLSLVILSVLLPGLYFSSRWGWQSSLKEASYEEGELTLILVICLLSSFLAGFWFIRNVDGGDYRVKDARPTLHIASALLKSFLRALVRLTADIVPRPLRFGFPFRLRKTTSDSQSGSSKIATKGVTAKSEEKAEELNFFGKNLVNADFKGRRLVGAEFHLANISGANFSGANLERVLLLSAIAEGADFQKARLSNANMREMILRRANLAEARLEGVNLSYADLQGANIGFANLRKANLRHTNFRRANLENAVLTEADLTGADMEGAVLNGAHLEGADLGEVKGLAKGQISAAHVDDYTRLPRSLT